jgi:RNA polymerase sigma factor (sigma-70 family)
MSGADDSLDALFRTYHGRLRAFAAHVFGADLAEDISSETFLRVVERSGRLDLDRDIWPWLVVVARNVGHDLRRSAYRHQRLHEVVTDEPAIDPWEEPVEHVIRSETAARVRDALAQLREPYRTVLCLRHFDHMSMAEMAAVLNISEGACRIRLYRARHEFVRRHLQRLRATDSPASTQIRSHRYLRCTRQAD